MSQQLQRKIENESPFYREMQVKKSNVDIAARTVTMSFSSELPVQRWFGMEILDHSREAVDFSRFMDGGGAVLDSHDWTKQIGVVEKAWLDESDRRLYATMRFSKNKAADEIFQDIIDGIRKNVSFGYRTFERKLESEKDNIETYRVTRWQPFEISSVAVPADPTVGLGRSASHAEKDTNECEVLTRVASPQIQKKGNYTMEFDEKKIEEMIANGVSAQLNAKAKEDVEKAKRESEKINPEQIRIDERSRQSEIRAIAATCGVDSQDTEKAINENISVDGFRKLAIDKFKDHQQKLQTARKNQELGLSEKESKGFSFLRVMNAMANPTDAKAQDAAKYEFEISAEYAKKLGKDPQGILVPPEVLRADISGDVREFNLTTGGGSNLRPTTLLAGSFIEKLDNAMLVKALGATMLRDLVGNIAIPRQTGRSTAYWINPESSGIDSGSQPTVDQVTLSPKTVGAYTDISRRLMLQASLDVENLVRSDLAMTMALALDLAALAGTGTNNQPTGVINQSGIGAVEWDSANTPTWAKVVRLETEVDNDNALFGNTFNYITTTAMKGVLKTTPKVSGYPVYLINEDDMLNGYPLHATNQLSTGQMLFGKFSDILIGMWGGLDLQINPYIEALALKGAVRVITLQDVDCNIRKAQSFALASNPSGS